MRGLGDDETRGVYASLRHNEEVLGKEVFRERFKGVRVGVVKGAEDASAVFRPDRDEIWINPRTGLTFDSFKPNESGVHHFGYQYMPDKASMTKSIVDHEMGHAVMYKGDAGVSGGRRKAMDSVKKSMGSEATATYVSGYAATDGGELAAEVWATNLNNGSPNQVSRNLFDYIKGLK